MKKLLIAMSAAAMFSLCAKADTLLGGIDFETGYSAGDSISVDASDPGTQSLHFWTGDAGESTIAADENPANKYLKVDTTAPLVRQTTTNATAIAAVDIGDGDITVSSKVQFTAADEAPEAAEGDKLIVWAKAPDEDDPNSTTTNLMVTAKTAAGVVTNFVTDVLVDAETWYDLQIVAKAEGSGRTATSTFVVKIAEAGQTPTAVTVDNVEATFYSLLAAGATGAQTIASIGFKGTGAVDDIVFAKNEGVVVPDVTVAVSITENYEVYLDPGCTLPYTNAFTVVAGQDAVVYVLDEKKEYTVTCQGATVGTWDSVNHAWPVTYTTSADNLSVTMTITVTEGGKTPITDANVTLSATEAVYTAGMSFPTVTVVVGGTTLTENTDYTVSWSQQEITAAGEYIVTVTGNGDYSGEVYKTFTVTAPGSEKAKVGDTEYDTGADFVAAATSGTVNTLPTGWTVAGNVVKDANGDTFATFPSFYNLTLANGTLTLELNNDALDTVDDLVEVSVGEETFGLKVSDSDEKLYYGLSSSATVNGTYDAPTALTKGTGEGLTLSAAKGNGSARFYKLYVTDIAPAPAN